VKFGSDKFGNNIYPQHIRHRLNLGHIFLEKKVRLMGREIWYIEINEFKMGFKHQTTELVKIR
jgi:hypothetical protein